MKIIEQVEGGNRIEDDLVELKREWIDPNKAARQIAGHANAARGETILWLFGIDEAQHEVTGVQAEDLSKWWDQVQSRFDERAPSIGHVNISQANRRTVLALAIDTEAAPFVVKSTESGRQREVLYREGTRVQPVTRSQLLRLLTEPGNRLDAEVLSRRVSLSLPVPQTESVVLHLNMFLFVELQRYETVIIPHHRCSATFQIPEMPTFSHEAIIRFTSKDQEGVLSEPSQTIVNSAGKIRIDASTELLLTPVTPSIKNHPIQAVITLNAVRLERPTVIQTLANPKQLGPDDARYYMALWE